VKSIAAGWNACKEYEREKGTGIYSLEAREAHRSGAQIVPRIRSRMATAPFEDENRRAAPSAAAREGPGTPVSSRGVSEGWEL